jgi:ATP-dependent 26S proteasome regulatory subunit
VEVEFKLDDLQVWEKVRQLAQIVGGWKKTQIAVSGAPVTTFAELERSIGHVVQCYVSREQSGIGELYCSGRNAPNEEAGCFGCRFAAGVSRQLNSYRAHSYWYQFGELSTDLSAFTVDKGKILQVCKARVGDHLCIDCAAFSWSRVWEDIVALPDVLHLGDGSQFRVTYSRIDPSKPIGVEPRESPHDHGLSLVMGVGGDREGRADDAVRRNVPSVRYSDIAAQDAALTEIRNVVELPLTHPEYFAEIGVEPQRGLILYGPPGNGKTLIAKAVATESDSHLEVINGPEILSKWVGQSEENLRGVFQRARELAPSVILIDEIDALAPNRDDVTHQHEVQLISQLLVLLDGLEARGRVAVIGTTNRIGSIDAAIRRPGRFDYHIEVPSPDQRGREAILSVYLRGMKATPGIDLARAARETAGFSGADLAALCREAGLVAIHRGITEETAAEELVITQDDLTAALVAIRHKRVASLPEDSPIRGMNGT